MTKLEKLIEKKNKLQAELKKQGKAALEEFFGDLFKNTEGLTAVSWCQYIPGFNDGDPCTFHVMDPDFRFCGTRLTKAQAEELPDHPADDLYDRSEAEDPTSEDEHGGLWVSSYSLKGKPNEAQLRAAGKALDSIEDLLEDTFGSNARIVVLPAKDGVAFIECDYDCGH